VEQQALGNRPLHGSENSLNPPKPKLNLLQPKAFVYYFEYETKRENFLPIKIRDATRVFSSPRRHTALGREGKTVSNFNPKLKLKVRSTLITVRRNCVNCSGKNLAVRLKLVFWGFSNSKAAAAE
jgi:hypothetical protein